MLVPEISLTPQTVDRFISRFGEEKIAVLHSKLSVGERYDQWQKIQKGTAKIVIGARSAIFAPVHDIGIIIIDEEHDQSYKSEMTPRYHAKEIASFIAEKNDIPLVLGSATPSLETYYKGLNGEIEILTLNKRANSMELPDVEIVDLRQELAQGNRSMISTKLYGEICLWFDSFLKHDVVTNNGFFSLRVMELFAEQKNFDVSVLLTALDEIINTKYDDFGIVEQAYKLKSKISGSCITPILWA